MYEGFNSDGFTGLLTPIGAACDALREEVLRPAFDMLREKLSEASNGVEVAAYKYGLEEIERQEAIERAGTGGPNIAI